jgi:predicted Zn-dependent peptidase
MGDDSPTRKCFKNLLKALYVKHPISIDVAGTVESIAKITPEIMYKCYDAFYDLHNMVLAIAGNIDEQKVLEICDKTLKASPDKHLESFFPQEPREVAKKTIVETGTVGIPVFSIGFKANACEGREYLKRSVIAGMLLEQLIGQTSPLYNQLLEEGLISSGTSTFVYTSADRYFCCIIEGESEDPDLVYQRICREIERLEKEGIDRKRFEIDKRVRYGEKISSINDVKACADAMLYYHMDCDDVTLFEDVDMIASLTAQECQQALPELFDIDKSSISIVTDKNDY